MHGRGPSSTSTTKIDNHEIDENDDEDEDEDENDISSNVEVRSDSDYNPYDEESEFMDINDEMFDDFESIKDNESEYSTDFEDDLMSDDDASDSSGYDSDMYNKTSSEH